MEAAWAVHATVAVKAPIAVFAVKVPLLVPTAVGVHRAVTVHEAPCASDVPQVWLTFVQPVPLTVMVDTVMGPAPVLVSVPSTVIGTATCVRMGVGAVNVADGPST